MSTCVGNPDNIKIERVAVSWANHETQKIQAVADVADSLDGKYFTIDSADGIGYYVWFDGVAAADPAPAGRTAIPVAYTTADSAATIAGLMATAIDLAASFFAKIDACAPSCVIVQDKTEGVVAAAVDVDSGMTPSVLLVGDSFDLGFTDDFEMPAGGLELVDISALQNGTTIIQRLRSGRNLEAITVPMKESDAAKIQAFLAVNGDSYTPAGGTEIFGLGTSKLGAGVLSESKRFRIHPVRLADGDRSEDYMFWRAFPALGNISFSAESEEMINVEFSLLPDPLITDEVSQMVFGNWDQNLLK